MNTNVNDPWATGSQSTPERPKWMTEQIEKMLDLWHYPKNQDGMLMLWQKSKELLNQYKETEMDYRKICAAFLVPEKTEGTTNVELGSGYVAKVVTKYNYKLPSNNDKIWETLEKISAIGNEGKFIADRLVSWTPNFLKTEYTTLQEEADKGSQQAKDILAIVNTDLLTITEAAPTLAIVEPKAKKK